MYFSIQYGDYFIGQQLDNIFYYQTKDYPMTNLYSRANYSPYSKPNVQESEQLPLRPKAFSQIDNTTQNYAQSQYTNVNANQDKISQIKKKYEKLLSRSNNKSNQENAANIIPTHEFGKSVSTFDANNQNSRWSPYNKSYQTPTTNKDRRIADPYEIGETKHAALRQYAQRQYLNPSKMEVKSQLQSNRMTLNAMKNQLQSKLNDLSAKTSGSSALRNPSLQVKEPERKEQINSTSYEAILNKYSKNIVQNRGKSTNETSDKSYSKYRQRNNDTNPIQKIETLETKIKETVVSSYIPKYTSNNRNNVTVQKSVKEKELSTISEISNSNHSENPTCEIENKDHIEKIYQKYRKIQNNVKQNAESNIIIEKPKANESKPPANNWFKNTTSYLETKAQQQPKKEQLKVNMEFTLQKLENSEGFSITRTVTQQNFMNLNKLNQVQARFEQRERSYSGTNANIKNIAQPPKKQPITPTAQNRNAQETIKQNQKSADEKSQIQKLKEKYSVNTAKYTNPYREKKIDQSSINSKDMKNGKEFVSSNSIKEPINEKQAKVEPRNNEVISKQIEKLDMKIKQIEQNKKDLNINFRPYDVSKSVPKVPAVTQAPQSSIPSFNKVEGTQKYNAVPSSLPMTANNERNKYNLRYQAYLERVKPLYSQITLSESQKPQSTGFAIKLMPVQYNADEETLTERSFSQATSKSRVDEYKNKVQLENRTDTGIEERKKKLQDKVEVNNNIKNLVKAFGQQAVYDEVFRNNKIWFSGQKDQKWGELKRQLSSINININQTELKSIFELDQSENNPFFSVSDNKCNMKTLVQSFRQAQRHWQEKIVHKFNRAQLQKQGFSSSKIDYDKKGFIQIEDLVRFLNIQSGSFLRNRDVSIIFKRIVNNGNKMQFNQIVSVISQ